VRVHFVDKSCKAIAIDNNTTAADLRETVIERIELKEEACFYLFEKRDDWGMEQTTREKERESVRV
jgi:hypothetical protein